MKRLLASMLIPVLALCAAAQKNPEPSKVAWPKLDAPTVEKVFAFAGQFRKEDAKLHAEAAAELTKLGAGVAPFLFQRVSDRDEATNRKIFAVLDGLLLAEHIPLLAEAGKQHPGALRAYLTQRLCQFVDPAAKPFLQAMRKDQVERTAFHAQLGCLALGDTESMHAVMEYSKTHWGEEASLIAHALSKGRSTDLANALYADLVKRKPVDQMAGLRLARYLSLPDHKVCLRVYLDSPDHQVKKEAVNVCRVLAGEDPLEKLDVFQAIKLAQEWKKKL